MKKRTSRVSRRIVSLLMSMVLTLTMVTPAAFATEVVGGSGTAIIEGNANPADANPNEDTEGKDDVDKNAEDEQQPAEPDDENAEPSEGEDAVNEPSNEADTQEGEGTDTPVVAQRTVTVERYRTDAAYEVKIVVGVEEDGTTEKLDITYAIGADIKTATLKLTTADYAGEPIYIKTALDDVLVTEGENQTPALTKDTPTLEYTLPNEGDVTLYYGTQEDFVSAWYGDGTATGYYIRTAEELANFAQLVNSENDFSGKTITLGKNIVLDGSDWTPIGTKDNPFKGTFNGRNGSTYYTISGLNGDLFGVVNGIIQYVTISGGTGRLVNTLISGTVENCMSTAKVTGEGGGLVGTSTGTVKNSYYYNADSKNTPAVAGSGTVTNCFYLAETSTFDKKGTADDTGARTAEEFKAGRVTWELNGKDVVYTVSSTDWSMDEELPCLKKDSAVYELTLTKKSDVKEMVVISVDGYTTLTNGNTQYVYVQNEEKPITMDESAFSEEYMVTYTPTKPTKTPPLNWSAESITFYYSVGKAITPDTSWYDNSKDEFILSDAADLFGLAQLVNSAPYVGFSGKTVKLSKDIDLTGYDWIPIGGSSADFCGTLDGNGHAVTININKDCTAVEEYIGFVGALGEGGWIKNLSVQGKISVVNTRPDTRTAYVGGIVSIMSSKTRGISNCKSSVEIDAENCKYAGGIVGSFTGKKGTGEKIEQCLNRANIKIRVTANMGGLNVAGVLGRGSKGYPIIDHCWNEGAITVTLENGVTSDGKIAGIVGYGSNVTNCANYGAISVADNFEGTAAGIIAAPYSDKKKGIAANNYNVGDISGPKGKTYGLSPIPKYGIISNSYYLCKLNGESEQKYIESITNSKGEAQNITATTEDGKTVYKVGNDVLVNLLNENRGTYIEWINKQDAPYNPVHVTRWDGSFEPGVEGVITLVYDPNGGEGAAVTEQQRVEGNTDGRFTIKSDTELGFKHENGTFLGWSKTAGGEVAFELKNDGSITPASVSVKKDETLTLYAVWSPIWAGSGTEAAPYEIPDVGKLTALQTQVNENGFSYSGKWFRLTNNIDLNNEPWTPIGVDTGHPFSGSLDGGGKTISGLNVNTTKQWAGLFGRVEPPVGTAVIMRELTIENGSVKTTRATSWCGGLVAQTTGDITLNRVTVKNLTIEGVGIGGTGGLVGGSSAVMTDCRNEGGSVTGEYAGGLAGKGSTNGQDYVFSGCTNSAAVTGRLYAGGMTGCNKSASAKFTNCSNVGSISGGERANGIAAMGDSFIACINAGTVNSSGGQANGITGAAVDITQCGNTGTVNGGIAAGIARHAMRIEKCYNTGKISATAGNAAAYGIAGSVRWYIKNSFTYNVDTQVPLVSNIKVGTYGDKNEVTNSYYLASSATAVSSAGEYATLADFASGKVAWGVDGGTGAHANYWTQGANNYPVPIGEGTSTSYYRAKAECGTGGSVSIKSNRNFTGDADNAVYGPKGMSVTVTATPMDNTYALKSMTVQLPVGTAAKSISNPATFTMPNEGNVLVTATFGSATPSGGGGYYYGGSGDGTGTGDKDDEGLQDGLNMDVEYDIKGLVLGAYAEWGSNGGNKSFQKWLEENPNVVRALLTNSLDNMAAAAAAKKTDEASALAQALLASLNEHSGVTGKDGDAISKALQRFMTSGTEATFGTWLTTGSGMASGTVESIFTQYTDSLLALADRLYAKWESSGTSMTFPVWLDAQQVSMENLSETAEEPDTDTTNESQTTEAPEDVPDGQESEGQVSGNSIWEIIGTAVRENPIIVWSIVAVVAALVIVGAVRRYHKVKRDERDDNGAE